MSPMPGPPAPEKRASDSNLPNVVQPRPPPRVPDHELLCRIGGGSYGEVWLARSVLGAYRAVKVVYRNEFENDRPFEREFAGIKRFEPISRLHESQVDILHVGRTRNCFFYVMELADDQTTGQQIEPERYTPRTLHSEVRRRGKLPLEECVAIGLNLTTALEHLHSHSLVHRDVKPANIVFVNGTPKLADIGLVTGVDATRSYVGTEGYIPPDGPGTPGADLYSLGKVLYEISTGMDRQDFPEPPVLPEGSPEERAFIEFQEILLKACEAGPQRRYQTAREMFVELDLFRSGQSVARRRKREGRWSSAKKIGLPAAALIMIALAAYFSAIRPHRLERVAQTESLQRVRAEEALGQVEMQRLEDRLAAGDVPAALAELAGALRQNPSNRVAAQRLLATLSERSFALPRFPPLTHGRGVNQIASSQDGQWIATASLDGTAQVWGAQTGRAATSPLKHQGHINDFDFSPDSRWLLTVSADHTARVWDVRTGLPLDFVLRHEDAVTQGRFSADGQRVATASLDQTARVWDALNGQARSPPLRHDGAVRCLDFSPDGQKLITGSADGIARIWEIATGNCLHRFSHSSEIRRVSFSPDGECALTGSDDTTARIWSVGSGEPITPPLKHRGPVTCAAFSPDGSWVIAGGGDCARFWDARTGLLLVQLPLQGAQMDMANLSPDGERVVTGFSDGTARVWNTASGTAVTPPLKHGGPVRDADFSADGQAIITASADGARVWDLAGRAPVADCLYHGGPVRYAGFSPDGQRILTASYDGAARVRNAQQGQLLLPPLWHRMPLYWAQFSPDGTRIVTAAEDKTARLWDAHTGRPMGKSLNHQNRVVFTCFSPDGERVATASWDHTARVWNGRTGEPLTPPLVHSRCVRDVAFDPGGARLVTACIDGTAQIWSARTGEALGQPFRHHQAVITARFSPDGRRIVTASNDRTAQIWDAASGQAVGPPLKHADQVCSAEFSPDGELVVTASLDKTAQLWNVRSSRPVGLPLRHQYPARFARFSPDGQRVLVAARDSRVWDVRTGQPLTDSLLHDGDVWYAEFSPDGQRVITASWDRTARVWEVPKLPLAVPAWLPRLAEVAAGQRLNERGAVEEIDTKEFFEMKESLAASSAADPFSQFAKWFFAEPRTRTLSPFSRLTLPDYTRHRIDENTLESLREAARLAPRNGLALARLARRVFEQDPAQEPLRLEQADLLSRRALALASAEPEVWWSRAAVLAQRGQMPEATEALQRGSAQPPPDPEFWLVTGLIHENAGQLESAEQAFSKVIELAQSETNWAWNPLRDALQHRAQLRQRKHRLAEAVADSLRAKGIPLRPAGAKHNLIDLSAYYNAALAQKWHPGADGNNLALLPCGLQTLAGVTFDVRGLIQVGGESAVRTKYPERMAGIQIGQTCRRLHFLHSAHTASSCEEGTEIGHYTVHYAGGREQNIPIVVGRDLADWWAGDSVGPRRVCAAWTGTNDASEEVGRNIQIFKSTWENPLPAEDVVGLDMVSTHPTAAPFLVALTAE
jgi:WD40 repeat protein